ncbi:MAG: hypothetical protein R3B13_07135 [Polyangiaceae bacterium]
MSRPSFARRAWLGALLVTALGACGQRRRDTVTPAVCPNIPPAFPSVSDDRLRQALAQASHVVRGRVRFTGEAHKFDGRRTIRYLYVIVDIVEFRKGEAWTLPGRYQRAFPILVLEEGKSEMDAFNQRTAAETDALQLTCREDEAFWFVMDLPREQRRPRYEMPDPVMRAFGPLDVRLHAILPETEGDRLLGTEAR